MRVNQAPLRGETGRVAARVRELVDGADRPVQLGAAPDVPQASWFGQLAARVPLRLDPGRRAAWAMGAAVLIAALLTGLWVINSRPRALPVSDTAARPNTVRLSAMPDTLSGPSALAPAGTGAAVSSAVASSSASEVVVDVAGRVRHPGVYRLRTGSHIDDAIRAAGGARRGVDLSTLNLAAVLVDGQQVFVGSRVGSRVAVPVGPAPPIQVPAEVATGTSTTTSIAPVSLNNATLEQLETLPRVGPVTAQKILDYRAAHGGFSSIDQLKDVSGIGDVTFAGIAPLVTL